MSRRSKDKREAERARRKAFYEKCLTDPGSIGRSDGGTSGGANEVARAEADEREVKRVARDLLYTQPADAELVMKNARWLIPDPKEKADRNKKKDLADNLADVRASENEDVVDEGGVEEAAQGVELPQLGRAPEFIGTQQWFNTDGEAISIASEIEQGNVVLIDFWTYTCINCLRTLPYLTAWD